MSTKMTRAGAIFRGAMYGLIAMGGALTQDSNFQKAFSEDAQMWIKVFLAGAVAVRIYVDTSWSDSEKDKKPDEVVLAGQTQVVATQEVPKGTPSEQPLDKTGEMGGYDPEIEPRTIELDAQLEQRERLRREEARHAKEQAYLETRSKKPWGNPAGNEVTTEVPASEPGS